MDWLKFPTETMKKPYHPPKLIVYGDLTDLTRNMRKVLDISTK